MRRLCLLIALLICIYSCQTKESTMMKTDYYGEKHRPQFHFSPEEKWMNDPNGMVYHNGEYHLFYQHYPDSNVWGPMHWGHAVSKNMIDWEHLPIALYPDSIGYIFSGSAVVDWKNTSGFGSVEQPPLVAIFTYHNIEGERGGRNDFQTQGIAYSNDDGRTWTKYEGNPVIGNNGIKDIRDPKVTWSEPHNKWIMALAVGDHISFYSSKDLIEWKFESDFGKEIGAHGGVWECPDLFTLKDSNGVEKYVLIVSIGRGGLNGGSATQYFVGEFDGTSFIPDDEDIRWIDYGTDNYAGVTWADVPESDGRKLFIGWMSNWLYAQVVPTEVWRSAMTLPRELKLVQIEDKHFVASTPVAESVSLRAEKLTEWNQVATVSENLSFDGGIELELQVTAEDLPDLSISFENGEESIDILYEESSNSFKVDRTLLSNMDFSEDFSGIHVADRLLESNELSLRIYLDASSIEVFADNGLTAITELYFAENHFNTLKITSGNGITMDGKVYQIKSIWEGKNPM